jgi:flagellar basal body-associated protein FliL
MRRIILLVVVALVMAAMMVAMAMPAFAAKPFPSNAQGSNQAKASSNITHNGTVGVRDQARSGPGNRSANVHNCQQQSDPFAC